MADEVAKEYLLIHLALAPVHNNDDYGRDDVPWNNVWGVFFRNGKHCVPHVDSHACRPFSFSFAPYNDDVADDDDVLVHGFPALKTIQKMR